MEENWWGKSVVKRTVIIGIYPSTENAFYTLDAHKRPHQVVLSIEKTLQDFFKFFQYVHCKQFRKNLIAPIADNENHRNRSS